MILKHNILDIMDRDALKKVIDDLELEGIDRRSYEAMTEKLSRARRATAELLLEYLTEKQVKAICGEIGVDSTGRRKVLVKQLLSHLNRKATKPDTKKRARTSGKLKLQQNQRKKEPMTMSNSKSELQQP